MKYKIPIQGWNKREREREKERERERKRERERERERRILSTKISQKFRGD